MFALSSSTDFERLTSKLFWRFYRIYEERKRDEGDFGSEFAGASAGVSMRMTGMPPSPALSAGGHITCKITRGVDASGAACDGNDGDDDVRWLASTDLVVDAAAMEKQSLRFSSKIVDQHRLRR